MNAAEVIKNARRWADLHRANTYQLEGVKRVDRLVTLAEEQAAALGRVEALLDEGEHADVCDFWDGYSGCSCWIGELLAALNGRDDT